MLETEKLKIYLNEGVLGFGDLQLFHNYFKSIAPGLMPL